MPRISEHYLGQVRLLLAVLPHVAARQDFALKGGTAINFFVRNGPRLSVDIDLHYLPNNNRDTALAGIRANMQAIERSVIAALPGAAFVTNPKTSNSQVSYQGATIKLEPNGVIRGRLLEPVTLPLCAKFAEQFQTGPRIACLHPAELYAGKLCAALQRQHPRDLFDMHLLLEAEGGLSRELMDAFIVYLISQGKPIAELLAPNTQPIDDLYHRQFAGMADSPIALEELKAVQAELPARARAALTDADKQFLLGFKRGATDWSLLRHSHAQDLPAVRWKQLNLNRMLPASRAVAIGRLEQLLNRSPLA